MIEEARDAQSGVEFLTETRDDWKESVFGGHITWHLALYYFGKLLLLHQETSLHVLIAIIKFYVFLPLPLLCY